MSASLVGSEMCIRDRIRGRCRPAAARGRSCGRRAVTGRGREFGRGLEACLLYTSDAADDM
eukprot:5412808-Alexandrium_andersonii.AAC.1